MKRAILAAVTLFLLAFLSLQACTRLTVHRFDPSSDKSYLPGSLPYSLPKTTLILSVTYVLTNCETAIDSSSRQPTLLLDVETTITAVPVTEADETEQYYIAAGDLRSWFKETKLTLDTYPNRTLKTVNATITDLTGPIVTAAVGTAIKIAATAAVSSAPPGTGFCDSHIQRVLADVAAKRRLLSQSAAPQPSKDPSKPQSSQDARIAELQKEIGALVATTLTTKVSLKWSPTVSELKPWIQGRDAAIKTVPPDPVLNKWLTQAGRDWLAAHPEPKLTIFVSVDVPHLSRTPDQAQSSQIIDDLVLRDPALGTLRVCNGQCPAPQNGVASVDNVVLATNVTLPQLGRQLVIPLHNGLFQNSVLDVSISEDGVITRLGQQSSNTASTTLNALGANADTAKNALDARAKAQAEALTKAQSKAKDENKILADCLEAQKTIVKNGGSPIGSCQ